MSLPQPSPADDDAPPAPAPPEELFPVVAIGASAGGLEAFTQLLSHLPTDTGMAFVLVQHLDPSQPSLLTEIISRTTEMPVLEVTDGVAIAPNRVYVIPPNQAMTIAAGELRLQPRPRSRSASRLIDSFFSALALERGAKAIGVVLSGADADGTLGLEAIKAAGGITFSQSEASAKFSSMPHMAIATGQVDFIQTPEEIAHTLAHLSTHPYVSRPSPTEPAAPQDEASGATALAAILALLKRATKVDFAQYKPTTVKRRILRRMALHHLESLESYSQYLRANPEEVQALHQEILIGVTSFFRDGEVFTALQQTVFPALLRDGQGNPDQPLRIWVAGCSTGEEAYSIAMCLLEYLGRHSASPPIQIFATDVSERAIEVARQGWYSSSQVSDLSPERLQRFFVPVDGGYQINKLVRELCIFACQNLITDPPFSRLDLISCRNVLIYFGAALQSRVLPMFHYGLKPDGFLLLGSSETAGEFSHLFALVDSRHKLYAKQSSSLPLNFDFDPTAYSPSPLPPRLPVTPAPNFEGDLYALADQAVLSRYGPTGVLVNERLEILQFRGQTGTYLEPAPGRASLNLLAMAKEGLRLDLRTALYQAQQTGQAVQRRSLLTAGDRPHPVQIDILPVGPQPGGKAYYLVLFTDGLEAPATEAATQDPAAEAAPAAEVEINQYLQENLALRQDLDTTRSHLQSIIQEQEATNQDLRAANEEILSSNEELQSTNEELQTAKEEIQATNEELSTINDELYRRNAETARISDDFQNLLSSIQIPILMLEDDLRIRRFTPTAATLFNLIPGDVGRPLGDINHRLALDDLEARILAVISTLEQTSQEVQDQEGRWYDLRIRPYRTLDNRIDGAVVVLVDIDSLKRSAEQLSQARDYANAIVQTVRDALVVLDHDLRVVTANRQFYQTFQVSAADTEGRLIFELGNGQWDIPPLRSLLHDLLPQNLQVDNFEVVHNFETIGPQTMRLNARKMVQVNGDELVLLAIETVPNATLS